MKKTIMIAMVSTALIGAPAFAASNTDRNQTQGAKQMQPQNSGQSQQNTQNQQSAQNTQAISPEKLPRSEIRQIQQALDKDGFHAGTADGRWGSRTENAVKQFQQSKQIQANGQLDQQTVADLGLDASKFSQSQGK